MKDAARAIGFCLALPLVLAAAIVAGVCVGAAAWAEYLLRG